MQLDGIRWQIHHICGLCCFRNQYVLCCLAPCHFRHCIAWSHFDLLNHCTPPESHENFKTHRIIIIFIIFMGNYIAFNNYIKNFKLFHKFHKKPIFINCKNLCHLRNGISTWNKSPKWSLILYYSWWGLCWFLPSFVKTLFIRVCMSIRIQQVFAIQWLIHNVQNSLKFPYVGCY